MIPGSKGKRQQDFFFFFVREDFSNFDTGLVIEMGIFDMTH